MNDDIDVAETLTRNVHDGRAPLFSREIGLDKQFFRQVLRARARGRQHLRAEFPKQADGRSAGALGSSSDEGSLASQVEKVCHHRISSLAILPFSMVKAYESVTGLPGNWPLTLARTSTLLPSMVDSKGSEAY